MNAESDIAEFLASRRARVTTEQVGLPAYGPRRVKGCVPLAFLGELELDYEVVDVSADDGLTISVYSAEPGGRSAQALDLLASWAATPEPASASADE